MDKRGKKRGKEVNCNSCGILFYVSPSRLKKNKKHHCGLKCSAKTNSVAYSNKIEVKCFFCKKSIFLKASRAKQIAYPSCSDECASKIRSLVYSKDNNPRALGLDEFEKFFWEKTKDCARRAKSKSLSFDLDYMFLKNIFEKQEGKCYYSGLKMELKSNPNRKVLAASYDVASVDRIDSELGYTKDNVVWALNCINMFKGHHKFDDIKKVMKAIVIKERGTQNENQN